MDPNQPKRGRGRCCVPNCTSYKDSEQVIRHVFPSRKEARKKWLDSLNISDEIAKKSAFVCSYHFLESDYFRRAEGDPRFRSTLKRNAIPSPFCHKNPAKKVIKKSDLPTQKKTNNQPSPLVKKIGDDAVSPLSSSSLQTVDELPNRNFVSNLHDHHYQKSLSEDQDIQFNSCDHNIIKTEDVLSDSDNSASNENEDFSKRYAPHSSVEEGPKSIENIHPSPKVEAKMNGGGTIGGIRERPQRIKVQKKVLQNFMHSKEDLLRYTGIDFELLKDLEEAVDFLEKKKSYKKVTDSRSRIILCLTRLKLKLTYLRLGPMIGLTRATCVATFRYMITLLSKILTKLIFWPPREEYFQRLPGSSQTPKKISISFHFIEIPVEEPACLSCRDRLRSVCSNPCKFLVKILVGIAPTGLIIYISEAFGGQASSYGILQHTNILSRLDPSADIVMIDKSNEDIETECSRKNICVIKSLPTHIYNNISPVEEGPNAIDIINVRRRVACTLEKLKTYGILKGKIKATLIPYVEEICVVIGALVNLKISAETSSELADLQCK